MPTSKNVKNLQNIEHGRIARPLGLPSRSIWPPRNIIIIKKNWGSGEGGRLRRHSLEQSISHMHYVQRKYQFLMVKQICIRCKYDLFKYALCWLLEDLYPYLTFNLF